MNQRPRCGPKRIVYPVKYNCVNCYSESEVEHVHPSHTTVMNHHLVKNKHVYPHSTSTENTCNEVDVNDPNKAPGRPGNVGGAMSPHPGAKSCKGHGPGPQPMPNQCGGAMSHGPMPPRPGHHHHDHGQAMGQWPQHNKWC